LPKTERYLKENGITLKDLIPSSWDWSEVILFDFIDENKDGIPDEKFGKNFEVVYYGIVEKEINKKLKGEKSIAFSEDYSYNKKMFLGNSERFLIKKKNKVIWIKNILLKV